MLKDRLVAVLLAMVLFAAPVWAQTLAPKPVFSQPTSGRPRGTSDLLFSPSVADRFWEIAADEAHRENISGSQTDQAIIFLTAAKSLNAEIDYLEPLLLRLATRHSDKDYSEQVVLWLEDYVDESADRVIVMDAIHYLLDRLNSREARQQVLEALANKIGNKNAAIDSELAALLGLLMLEKADLEPARFYLVQAYTNNKYNKTAFAKLAELAPDDIGPAVYLEHLHLVVREDPLDIEAVLNFAQYAERLQLYDMASQSYLYGAELFQYLYPTEPLPPHIYLPWAISSYNTKRAPHICLQIAESVRRGGRFDILLEAIAGRAAAKTGNPEEARRIFRQAERQAQQLLESGPETSRASERGAVTSVRKLSPKQFAWFYCFADPNPEKALDWANKAYSVEPNVPSAGALLAYALSMNGQLEWAKPLLESREHTQIADLVRAEVQLSQGNKAAAVQTLKAAVTKDPGSFAAERAKERLREQGSEYTPPVDPTALMTFLTEKLGKTLVPQFSPPNEMMDVQFNIRGNEFSYGSEIEGTVAIVNKASEPLVVTQDGLFKGNIRIDARVTGHLTEEIPNVVSRTVQTQLAVPPGRSLVSSLRLSTGKLRRILLTYPQASLDIRFTLYLDPVVAEDGSVSNRLLDLKPITISVTRPGMELSGSYVRNRFNAISSGQEAEKIRTARLFTGLLKEQYAMADHGTLYPFRYGPWLPDLLRSAFLSDSGLLLGDGADGWVVKVNAMADMLSLPIDQALATVLAKNLNHPKWPVRLMAVYLLAGSPGNDFGKVLDWVAERDTSGLVRSMAMALRSDKPAAGRLGSPAPDGPALSPP